MTEAPSEIPISQHIWNSRYRYRAPGGGGDQTLRDSWQRVAHALAAIEKTDRSRWEARFLDLLDDFRFLPGGRTLAGAGTGQDITLFNCFVMGRIEDSMDGIFDALREGALTMQQGGGVGYDFSTLRPECAPAWRVGGAASGPVSFTPIWDRMCETLLSTAARRGAMMATLRWDHPDIEAFVDAKGRAAASCRQCHIEDHQSPRRLRLPHLPFGLRTGLPAWPQGLYELSPECGHRVGAGGGQGRSARWFALLQRGSGG